METKYSNRQTPKKALFLCFKRQNLRNWGRIYFNSSLRLHQVMMRRELDLKMKKIQGAEMRGWIRTGWTLEIQVNLKIYRVIWCLD